MYRIGWATRAAALDARRQLLAIAAREFFEGSEPSDLDIVDGVIRRARPAGSNVQVTISQALNTFRSDTLGQTSSITGRPDVPMPPATAFARHFAAHFAEVEVDIETGEIKLLDYLATQDSGTVVNPQVLKNQAIGGAICGAGFAIYEHLAFDPATGAIKNASLLDYKLLRAADFPHPAMVLFADSYDPVGPFGARGAGEAPVTRSAPAAPLSSASRIGQSAMASEPSFKCSVSRNGIAAAAASR
jgi:CO/xanthine dehydrogenase Mo-binding subunit